MKHLSQNDSNDVIILLHIDRYTNIFSDFDGRALVERTLSIDFTEELRRQLHAREGAISGITFVIPESERDSKTEDAIKERMIAYFKKHINRTEEKRRKTIVQSILMILTGVVSMIVASYISTLEVTNHLPYSIFRVLLEPAAWFLLWEGANRYTSRMEELKPDIELYAKISKSHANIQFISESKSA